MQASDGETKGLGVIFRGGRPNWEYGVAGMSATSRQVLARGGCHKEEITRMCTCLSEVFSPVGRSSRALDEFWF